MDSGAGFSMGGYEMAGKRQVSAAQTRRYVEVIFVSLPEILYEWHKIHTGWAWNKVGTSDNHFPERFTNIHFSESYVEDP